MPCAIRTSWSCGYRSAVPDVRGSGTVSRTPSVKRSQPAIRSARALRGWSEERHDIVGRPQLTGRIRERVLRRGELVGGRPPRGERDCDERERGRTGTETRPLLRIVGATMMATVATPNSPITTCCGSSRTNPALKHEEIHSDSESQRRERSSARAVAQSHVRDRRPRTEEQA